MAPLGADDLIARLQVSLKGKRGGAPKAEIVAVAMAMARDPTLDRTKALQALNRGGSRTRAVEYCNRIVEENLLDCELSPPAADPLGGLPATMHVQPAWITDHASGLHHVSGRALGLYGDQGSQVEAVIADQGPSDVPGGARPGARGLNLRPPRDRPPPPRSGV